MRKKVAALGAPHADSVVDLQSNGSRGNWRSGSIDVNLLSTSRAEASVAESSRDRTQDRKRVVAGQSHELHYEATSRRTTTAVEQAIERVRLGGAGVDAELRWARRTGSSTDRQRISLNQPHEVRYWSGKFGVKPAQLRAAVRLVGPTTKHVQDFLLQRRLPYACVVPSLFGTVITNGK